MNKFEASKLANELMEKHGVTAMGYRFAFNNRRRAAGICSYRKRTIELSLPLTLLANVEDVTDTILHEIAHALAGPAAGHGPVWQRIAKSIGCNGKRCYGEEKASLYEAYKTIAKYKGVCPNGHESFLNRMPKNREYSCSKCSPRFNRNFLIKYSLNM